MKEYRISDELWEEMRPFLPRMKSWPGKRGRPATDYREILDAIFWLLKTGAQWRAVPSCYPAKSTVYERFQLLVRKGFFKKLVSKSPHEVTLVEQTLNAAFIDQEPERLIGDGAYDSDPLDERLELQRGIEVIAPHKNNRVAPPTQDGRRFRRYKRRWKVERLNAWLQNFRKLVVRYERVLEHFQAFAHFACAIILVNYV